MTKTVLITGCSTGIGRDLAVRLTEAGYTVAATARNSDTLADIPAALKLALDVTSNESVEQAVGETLQQFGRIDVLINNAGYGLRGVVEEVPEDRVRKVFEVNVFGVLRMIRAVAPVMRQQHSGRIINISSIAGRVVTPVNGVYSSTKFALEALSDAMRWEMAPFGIQVILIEPGPIRSRFDETAAREGVMRQNLETSPYREIYKKIDRFAASMRKSEYEPDVVVKETLKAISAPRPRARYLAGVNFAARVGIAFRDLLWETIANQAFKIK